MDDAHDRDVVVSALKHAAPYVRMYKRKVFVLKAGGEAFGSPEATRALLAQVALLHQLDIRVVLVHGGGPQTTALARDLGVATTLVDGRRVTDAATLDVATMALCGRVNTAIVAACREVGVPAVGVSGVAADLVRARRRPPVQTDGADGGLVDFGHVGDIEAVDPALLRVLVDGGFVPIVSPLCADEAGRLLNVNADTVAAALSVALGASKLILAMGAPGILADRDDRSSLVSYTDLAGLQEMRASGALRDGMLPKAAAVEAAIRGGVPRVHIISYAVSDSLLLEVFTNEGTGTMVVDSIAVLTAAEQEASRP